MSLLPKAKSIQQHKIRIGTKSLLMTSHETSDSITLYVGGHDLYCLNVNIIKTTSPMARVIDPAIANLQKIEYNQQCSLEGNFKRGLDTNMILKFIITYIKTSYPHVTGLSFNDASYRSCDNGAQVSLAMMSYITTGKTWYQNNFGAFLDSKSDIIFQKVETEFQQKKSVVTWEILKGMIDIPIEEDAMKEMYESAKTWQEFFGTLKDLLGVSEFCIFIAPWFDTFIKNYMRFNMMGLLYIIPVEDYGIVYTVSEYQRGGKAYTRKRANRHLDER